MTVKETIDDISQRWFLSEPAYFSLFCMQKREENVRMECAVRCGDGTIQYNPLLLAKKSYSEVEQLLRIELIRLFLKHPYERQPDGCSREAMAMGSDCTIEDGYCFKEKLPLKGPGFYHLPLGQWYEWYAKEIQKQKQGDKNDYADRDNSSNNGNSSADNSDSNNQEQNSEKNIGNDNSGNNDGNGDSESKSAEAKAGLWREDEMRRTQINDIINRTNDWGSIPGEIIEKIKASTQAQINNSNVFQGFRSSILSSNRELTRMRPNRRTGFQQMGNHRQYDTRLLVAIDVSGSITDAQLSDFYTIVNRLFRHGVAQLDCMQFDCKLGEIKPMQRTSTEIEIIGRGGTDYQLVFDYISSHENHYDGLMILTDGQAPVPKVPQRNITKVLWVCCDKQAYEASHTWMETFGRCCYL